MGRPAEVKALGKEVPEHLGFIGELDDAVIVIANKLIILRALQRLKFLLSGTAPLQEGFFFIDDDPQIDLSGAGWPCCRRLSPEIPKSLLPFFNFPRAPPFRHALVNGGQVGDWHHELWNRGMVFPGGISHVQPEFIIIRRKGGPDLKRIPTVAIQPKAHVLKIPLGDAFVLLTASECSLDFADEPGLLGVERTTQHCYQTPNQPCRLFFGFFADAPCWRRWRSAA